MNNHPRFSCKHAWKHTNPSERHHCPLCAGRHPPFLCPRAQVNGGPAQPNWYCEYKRAKQENREADYRLGTKSGHTYRCRWSRCNFTASIGSTATPMCSSSDDAWYFYDSSELIFNVCCPTIAEHQEFTPSMQPPMRTSMQQDMILPNPGYKIEANLWNLDIPPSACEAGPLAPFCVIAILWIVHTFQRIAREVQVNLQMRLVILTATHPWHMA